MVFIDGLMIRSVCYFVLALQSMSAFSRDDLHTDRSIQLDSEGECPSINPSVYLDKLESHMAFMEMEFKRNMDWQRKLLGELRRNRKSTVAIERRNDSALTLHLKQREEEKLKEILKDYCSISNDRLQLPQLVRLAASLKDKNQVQQREKEVSFPNLPRVITLNDFVPSTQRHLDSISPIRMAESRVKVPKYRQAAKTPHQLFSPEPEQPVKIGSNHRTKEPINVFQQDSMKQNIPLTDSLQKRLDGQNFVTFREYIADSLRNRLSDNVSLNLSSSRQEATSQQAEKQSLLLISDEDEPQQNPSIYLQLKLTKQKQVERVEERIKNEQEILCFSSIKKRKIAKAKEWLPKGPFQLEESKAKLKKLQDSFGKIYHEFEQGKHAQDQNYKPSPRDTLESDD